MTYESLKTKLKDLVNAVCFLWRSFNADVGIFCRFLKEITRIIKFLLLR